MVARALMIVHECIYDAWAAYDKRAVGTQLGGTLRQRRSQRTLVNKNKAISFAAYRAAVDVFPWDEGNVFTPLMVSLGYDPSDTSTDTTTPDGVGNVACAAVLDFRHDDGSNQLGNLTPSGVPYADYTGYVPVNEPTSVPLGSPQLLSIDMGLTGVADPNHWQPVTFCNGKTPGFVGAQWYRVTPFAMTSDDEFRPFISRFGPAQYGSATYIHQAQQLINLSANLTDEQKMIAEYWADGPRTELPPGHWDLFGQFVSARDKHTVDDDAKMFFVLTGAIHDAGIAAWDAKRAFDSVRPVTAIPYLFHGQQIQSWGGPGVGTVRMDGSMWIPYQPCSFWTPPFPEYISGHSTFSAAGATVLALWTGSENFGDSVTFLSGSSVVEPGVTPHETVTLSWATFHNAANQAGISRRYGGIHFELGDLVGRATGRLVGTHAWKKALTYFRGRADDDDEGGDHNQ